MGAKNQILRSVKNRQGMAVLEALPIILVMFILMGAGLGSWGIVHTAILNSISARHYMFFTFNHRADLSYLRDFSKDYGLGARTDKKIFYRKLRQRFSYIRAEKAPAGTSANFATSRFVDFMNPNSEREDPYGQRITEHMQLWKEPGLKPSQRNQKWVDPAWIMVGYGICLDSICSPN